MLAAYTLNLVLVAAAVLPGGCRSARRPWERLTHLWLLWYSLEGLAGVSAMLASERSDAEIVVRATDVFQLPPANDIVAMLRNVAGSFDDRLGHGLAVRALAQTTSVADEALEEAFAELRDVGADLGPAMAALRA